MKRPLPGQAPSLVPTGQLLQHDIVPFSGELAAGVMFKNGFNRKSLSGVGLSQLPGAEQYAQDPGFACNLVEEKKIAFEFLDLREVQAVLMSMRARIALLRLLQMNALTEAEKAQVKKGLQKQSKTSPILKPDFPTKIFRRLSKICRSYWRLCSHLVQKANSS